ncbi:hypothetical protein C7N43_27485 [Sphingobacteriales bacterium UPWRP_1]|nr:hypothetical protein BVG80_04965 [Sphingobacteriales bacterium TSM_CSM]PSJ73746.1 hypothetical protein C7N43_27485 [Sphingobacteriales bacterium UPWRP_1]
MSAKLIKNISIYMLPTCPGAMRSFAVFCLLIAVSCMLRGQNTNSAAATPAVQLQPGTNMPAGFPVYKDTGNPKEDAQRYDAANKAWMAANPGVIPAVVNSQWKAPGKTEIENNGTKVEHKTATIPPNQHYTQEGIPIPASQNAATEASVQPVQPQQVVPANYPKLVDTGNPEQDHRKFDIAKQAWIAANPAAYKKMFEEQSRQKDAGQVINNTQQVPELTKPETANNSPKDGQQTVMIPPPYNPNQHAVQQEMPVMPITQQIPAPVIETELPKGYPKYVDTGNVENADEQIAITANPHQLAEKYQVTQEDLSNMNAEKLEFIKAHPDIYEIIVEKKQNIQKGQIIQGQTLEKYKVTKDDLDKISPEKLIYMKAHPEVYDMIGIE